MTRVALKGMAARKARAVLTALAIVLGVAMVSGAFTLTDTMSKGADALSSAAYDGTAAVVTHRQAFKPGTDSQVETPAIPASTIDRVRQVPGVGVAVGDITDQFTKVVGKNGKTVGSGPYFGVGFDSRTPGAGRVSPFRLTDGRWATGAREVVLDQGTADKEHLKVGDPVKIATRGPARMFTVTGIARFGSVKSLGTATVAVFDLHAAQTLLDKQGKVDDVLVAARPGTSAPELRAALAGRLPHSLQVHTAAAQDRFTLDGLKQFIKWIRVFLLVFGGVAIFVGAFTIFNTLSITVAQRSREFAMLRTIGASRRQVLRSVLVEALVLGLLASAIGVIAGFGLGKGLQSLFASLGIDLPQTGTVFAAHTVIIGLLVGTLVTVAAGLNPALRATRVAPVTVLREGADVPAGTVTRRAGRIAVGTTVLGVALLAYGVFGSGISAGGRTALLLPGCLILFVGVALLSPKLVVPLASVLGRPSARLGGSAGKLARSNAMRNPGRTAATAAALMIGIALVAFVAVLGAGIKQSTTGSINDELKADYVVGGQDGWSPIDPDVGRAAATAPGVKLASSIKQDTARTFGKNTTVDGIDPATIGQVYTFDWKDGSAADLRSLAPGEAIVSDDYAKKHDLKVGSPFTITPVSGKQVRVVVKAIDSPASFNPLGLGDVSITQAQFAKTFASKRDRFTFLTLAGGASAAATHAIEQRLKAFPDAKVQTEQQFAKDQTAWISQILGIFYILLALAVICSLFGIVNTLVLSVFERTRELGMLRAVGMTRRQVRRMIRHESIVTALIGAVLGIAIGLFLSALVTKALSSEGLQYSIPVGALFAFVVVAVIAGTLAAILPARRAARLNVLESLQYE